MHITLANAYPECEGIIGNCFQSVVDDAGTINCFHLVVRVHNLTQVQCGVDVGLLIDGLKLFMRKYKKVNACKPYIIQERTVYNSDFLDHAIKTVCLLDIHCSNDIVCNYILELTRFVLLLNIFLPSLFSQSLVA